MWSYEQELENALWNESLTQGELMQGACHEHALNYGEEQPDREWILSNFDTWVRNPHYTGEPGPHPEDM